MRASDLKDRHLATKPSRESRVCCKSPCSGADFDPLCLSAGNNTYVFRPGLAILSRAANSESGVCIFN